MKTTANIAKHLREFHFGVNWTWVNLKETLSDVTWEQAVTKVGNFNTIAALVYHINYYVTAQISVLKGNPLTASDKFAFDVPPIQSKEDWDKLLDRVWAEAEESAQLVEALPDDVLGETFVQEKYGIYYRNLHGVIEHAHYHLGQIVILKKLIQAGSNE